MQRRPFLCLIAGFSALPMAARAAELHVGDGTTAPATTPDRRNPELARLAERRQRQIARVERYAREGVFPRNLDFEGARVPYFIDARGVPCAVAHLMIEDGLRVDVERIARDSNHVRVMDVTTGPIVTWVRTSGLLQEEAARIQPSYDFERPRPTPPPHREPILIDPNVVERDRIRRHLLHVVAELRRNTDASLRTATARLARG